MESQVETFEQIFTLGRALQWGIAALILVIGILLSRLARRAVWRLAEHHVVPQQAMIAARMVSITIVIITIAATLNQAGIDISVALGAAGIVTVALGFAAQTSASNLISGLFLMGEKPFVIGDSIQIGSTTGEVISIDLLSAKLRTVDNLLVRIPNETLLKSEIVNLTRFEKRRLDLLLDLAYKTDLDQVKQVLVDLAAGNELALEDPAPSLAFLGFGESALNLRFSVWVAPASYLELKTSLLGEIKKAFEKEGIQFPYPHRALVANAPIAVKVVE